MLTLNSFANTLISNSLINILISNSLIDTLIRNLSFIIFANIVIINFVTLLVTFCYNIRSAIRQLRSSIKQFFVLILLNFLSSILIKSRLN